MLHIRGLVTTGPFLFAPLSFFFEMGRPCFGTGATTTGPVAIGVGVAVRLRRKRDDTGPAPFSGVSEASGVGCPTFVAAAPSVVSGVVAMHESFGVLVHFYTLLVP